MNINSSLVPLLSIIIPAYNSDRFLEVTLSMLVSQGLDDCEIIVVNDGSTDRTEEICHSFATRYGQIKFVTIENSGVSVARNTGLKQATGAYIYFFDSDDTLAEGSIDFFKQILLSGKDFQIFSFGYETQRNGKIIKKYIAKKYNQVLMDAQLLQRMFFSKKLSCNICSCIYDRNFLVENNLFFIPNIKIGEDVEFLINSFSLLKSFYYESRLCFIYQIRNDSVMQGYKKYSIDQFISFLICKECIVESKKKYPGLAKQADFFMANFYISNLRYYLFSEFKSIYLNRQFVINKKILSLNISGSFFHHLIILIIKITPLNILFCLYGKTTR
jgi:glycosyltransferase involved in cell wall biosynthesis